MVLIDIPQIAYKTWSIEYNTGNRKLDYELERDMKQNCPVLRQYPYSEDHEHVRQRVMKEYIDRIPLVDHYTGLIEEFKKSKKYSTAQMVCEVALENLLGEPLADVRPIKHGKWIKPTGMMPPEYAGHYECSVCGSWAVRDWKRHKQLLSKFCPYCGTRMENAQDEIY